MIKRTCRNLADRCLVCGGDQPSCKCNQEEDEWWDWSNLPSVLIDDIVVRVRYDVTDYIHLRVSCKEWRKCTGNPRDLDIRPRRWTMLSNNTDGVRHRFLNLSTGACVHVNLQELSTHQVEASTEGLLLLRDKVSHAVRLLNPLTGTLTDLPPITAELGQVHAVWTEKLLFVPRIFYAGISEETSPATVVLMMRGVVSSIEYAKPGDKQWALLSDCLLDGRIRHSSVSTLQGRVYLATYEGNILQVDLAGERLVPVEDIRRHRALFVGESACFSLSTERFPSVAGNAVYIGPNGYSARKIGVRYLEDRTTDPPFQFVREESACTRSHGRVRRFVPIARPCTLQEYLVCCAGIRGGMKD
ncbi:hypothetical protein ACQ4PT_040172 [Festuca glaucescens]